MQVKYVSARDAGSYECQVSTVPKISKMVDLVVVVPKVRFFKCFFKNESFQSFKNRECVFMIKKII